MSLRRAAAPLVAAVLALLLVDPASAQPHRQERVDAVKVTFTGYGWGHGKGLSQYGARNRAQAGQSYRQILAFYYPGTRVASTTGRVRVLLTADTTRDVVVLPASGLKVHSLGAGRTWRLPAKYKRKPVLRWRIMPAAGHRSAVQLRTGKRWHTWRTPRGDAEFLGSATTTLLTPSGRATYRGALRSVSMNASGSSRDTVNVVSLDSYVRGVVPSEMPAAWPAAALQSQAVAARTYAASERASSKGQAYDLCDTAHCQVYRGYGNEHASSDAAVRATARKIVTYGGKPAFTQFSASNGGVTADGGFPYLRSVVDSYDHGYPGDPWTRTFTGPQITRNWSDLGTLKSVRVTQRDAVTGAPYGGRPTQVTVTDTADHAHTVEAATLARWLGLRSDLFSVR